MSLPGWHMGATGKILASRFWSCSTNASGLTNKVLLQWGWSKSGRKVAPSHLTIGLPLLSRWAGWAAIHVAVQQVTIAVARRRTGNNRGTILWVTKIHKISWSYILLDWGTFCLSSQPSHKKGPCEPSWVILALYHRSTFNKSRKQQETENKNQHTCCRSTVPLMTDHSLPVTLMSWLLLVRARGWSTA